MDEGRDAIAQMKEIRAILADRRIPYYGLAEHLKRRLDEGANDELLKRLGRIRDEIAEMVGQG